jgi:hypothetical protein
MVDFVGFNIDSIILVECTMQFLADRTIIGEYEIGKLTHVKAILENHGHKVYAILVCSDFFDSNPALYSAVIGRFGNQIHFMFGEDLNQIQANISTITSYQELLGYSRNNKLSW